MTSHIRAFWLAARGLAITVAKQAIRTVVGPPQYVPVSGDLYSLTELSAWSSPRMSVTQVIVLMRSAWKIDLIPTPFKVTDGYHNRHGSIRHDFLLAFHIHYPISYRFQDKRRFQPKIASFPAPTLRMTWKV